MARRTILKPYQPKPLYVPKVRKHEEGIQRRICSYLKMQYPHVIFRSDYASGLKLSMAQAVTHSRLQSGKSWPDLFIYMPRKVEGRQYAGMALELKKEGTSIKLKIGPNKGKLVANVHIREQYELLKQLNHLGYFADFGVGFDDAVKKIDWYLGKPENLTLL